MWNRRVGLITVAVTASLAVAGVAGRAAAWPFSPRPAPAAAPLLSDGQVEEVQRAIDEHRLIDAGQLIDELTLIAGTDNRLKLMTGELGLARGRYADALAAFQAAQRGPAPLTQAMQGEAIALAELGRESLAMPLLMKVVAQDPKAWRAWNALGAEYDGAAAWADAEGAYQHAITVAPNPAIPLNNRGYSRLLQGRLDAAVADLVAALDKQPDLTAARANLRLALALRGDYDRAVDGASDADRAASLNNAGLAAGVRGDFAKAESLLTKAMEVKGQYYQRASENLNLVHALATRVKTSADAPR